MSEEASTTIKETSEQEHLQPLIQQPAVEEADLERVQENVDGTESAGSVVADDTSDLAAIGDNTKPQSNVQDITTGGGGIEDSVESFISGRSSSTESQQGGASDGISRQLSQESGAFFRKSQEGNGRLHLLCAIGGAHRRDSPDGAPASSSINGSSSYRTALSDSCSRASLESSVAGGISNSQDSKESSANVTGSWEGIATPVPPPTASVATQSATTSVAAQSDRRSPEVTLRQDTNERVTPSEEGLSWEGRLLLRILRGLDRMGPFARGLRKSIIYRIFNRPVLLILAISAIYMGIKYHFQCPAKEMLPFYCMWLGVAGIVLFAFTFALDLRYLACPSIDRGYFYFGIVVAFVMFLWHFIDVLIWTYGDIPSFDPSDEKNYCDETFYIYCFSVNILIGILLMSAGFILFSTRNDSVAEYERF
ncbi:uncharacterized protein LOC129957284 [Argiope bruennichi]|uniref:uncharacterized protein LOC129957284 n=1 Tax=Argiope bruennichi TaxID=94029 RepID=UPI002493DEDB|nr:uncharacterized protein LOC129957284 [Argiope bruennichi]